MQRPEKKHNGLSRKATKVYGVFPAGAVCFEARTGYMYIDVFLGRNVREASNFLGRKLKRLRAAGEIPARGGK